MDPTNAFPVGGQIKPQHIQLLGKSVGSVNYCSLIGRPSLVICLCVTVWAASILEARSTQVQLDLAHRRLGAGENFLSCKPAES